MSGVQFGLFGGPKAGADGRVEIPLDDASPLVLWRGWLAAHAEALDHLTRSIPWEQHRIGTPAGLVAAPRLECWFSDEPGRTYTYSGETYVATPIGTQPVLRRLRDRVEDTTGQAWDAVFANLYRDGSDSIGWHADDEEDALGPAPTIQIASLSLGIRRPFNLKHRESGERVSLELGHGDLLLMGDRTQSRYLHSVPKRPAVVTPRINLTFRRLVGR